jgi:hypothetical protein
MVAQTIFAGIILIILGIIILVFQNFFAKHWKPSIRASLSEPIYTRYGWGIEKTKAASRAVGILFILAGITLLLGLENNYPIPAIIILMLIGIFLLIRILSLPNKPEGQ